MLVHYVSIFLNNRSWVKLNTSWAACEAKGAHAKEYLLYDPIYIKFKNRPNLWMVTKVRITVSGWEAFRSVQERLLMGKEHEGTFWVREMFYI